MIASGDLDLHEMATVYFPDSTVTEGFDLHAREIGNLDTFRLVFYEYFDLYSTDSESYMGIFSPAGEALDIHNLKEVSFEGNPYTMIVSRRAYWKKEIQLVWLKKLWIQKRFHILGEAGLI